MNTPTKHLVRASVVAVAALGTTVAATLPAAAITHAAATSTFSAAGISWTSSGGCSDRTRSNCTSFDGLRSATAEGAVTLKKASGCPITITGGTEVGHASGTYSHSTGYKLDFALNSCLDNWVKGTYTKIATRSDGAQQWKAASGNVYALESNHWDVTFFSCGC